MKRFWLQAVVLSACLLSQPLRAADWPQWRGPHRDGHVPDFVPPKAWPKELRREWQVTVGEGHSSPVVADGRVFIHSRQDDAEHVRCLDLATGKIVWQDHYAAKGSVHPAAASHGLGPKSTPVVHQGRLYTLGIGSILSCYDAKTGRKLWHKDFKELFPQPAPSCGTSMSPLVVDGLCIVHVGLDSKGALLAFDAVTGTPRWSYDADGPGYSSPILATVRGEAQLVTLVSQAVAGFSVTDGKLLWRVPFQTTNTQNIVTPVATKETIIAGGIGQPLLAMRPPPGAETKEAEVVWRNPEVPLHMSSPVLVGNLLFGMSHRKSGCLFCLDATTGKLHWQTEGRFGQNAALLHAGSVLVVLKSQGELEFVAASATEYRSLATYRVSQEATWAHPALVGNRILVKDTQTLTCWVLEP